MVRTLTMMSKSRRQPLAYTIVPVMFDRRTQASVSSLLAIRNTYPKQVWPGMIPIDTKFRDASKAGLAPHLFEPNSRGVEAYGSLRSEEHTSELQSRGHLVCRLLLEK